MRRMYLEGLGMREEDPVLVMRKANKGVLWGTIRGSPSRHWGYRANDRIRLQRRHRNSLSTRRENTSV